MWTPWAWGRASNEAAIATARRAATLLHRAHVERLEIEEYVARRAAQRPPADGPVERPADRPAGPPVERPA